MRSCLLLCCCLAVLWAQDSVTARHNTLSCQLLQQQCSQPGTQISSGLSLAMALGMSRLGAVGSSRQELDSLLAGGGDPATLAADDAALLATLGDLDQLVMANAIWSQPEIDWQDEFLAACRQHYAADTHAVDFMNNEAAARETINAWCNQTTRGLVPRLFTSPLPPQTRMVLTNAFSYIGSWQTAFDPAQTSDLPFATTDGPVAVPMMRRQGTMTYAGNDLTQLLSLPLSGDVDLLLILPAADRTLDAVIAGLDAASLAAWQAQLRPRPCDLMLPRCDLSAGGSLVPVLRQLGLADVFAPMAGFTGMTDDPQLHIGDVVQRCRLQIDEQGVKAAAATGVVMVTRAMPRPPQPFHCDQPFLLLLQHRPSGALLLSARISDPRG